MKRLILITALLFCVLPFSFQALAQSSTATPYPTYTMYPTYTQFPITTTPSVTATLSATDRAQLRKANATSTREQYYANLTASADSRSMTRTAVSDIRTATAESIQATRTFVALFDPVSKYQLVQYTLDGTSKAVKFTGKIVQLIDQDTLIINLSGGAIVVRTSSALADLSRLDIITVYGVMNGTVTVTVDGTDFDGIPLIDNSTIVVVSRNTQLSQSPGIQQAATNQQNIVQPVKQAIPTQTQQAVQPTAIPPKQPVQPTAQSSGSGSLGGNPGNGATALCNDGTYSFAAHHQGACSHHGGVKEFYK